MFGEDEKLNADTEKNFEKDFETYITSDASTLQLTENDIPDWNLC